LKFRVLHLSVYIQDVTCTLRTDSSGTFRCNLSMLQKNGLKILSAPNHYSVPYLTPAWGSAVVKALRYYSEWCHWRFFPWLLLTKPCVLRSIQPPKMSTRDFSWGKGGRCVWLTTSHNCSAESREDPGP